MKSMRRGLCLVGLAAGATAASAQTLPPERHFDVGVAGTVLYETNVSHTGPELAALRGIRGDDVSFTPALTVDLFRPIGRQSLSLIGSVGYDFYARNTVLNRERIEFTGEAGLAVARCDVTLNGYYARRQSDLGDLVLFNTVGPLDRRVKNVEDIKTIGATAFCGDEIGLRPTAGIQQTWVDNSSDLRQISDYRSTTYTAGVAYARPSFGVLTLFGRYETADFPRRSNLPNLPGGDGYTSKGGGVRYEREIGSRLRGLVELAYTDVDPSGGGVRGFGGLTWRANLTAQPGARLRVTAQAARSVSASNRVDANYLLERFYDLDATYTATDRMSLTAGALYRQRDYRGGFIVAGPLLTEDNIATVRAGVNYRIGRRINAGLFAAHDIRRANGTLFDYDSTRVGLTVRTIL